MFRNDKRRGEVCCALTRRIPGGPYWSPDAEGIPRPTGAAIEVRATSAGLPRSERTMIRIAWDIWNGNGGAAFLDMVDSFDGATLVLMGTLLVALAGDASGVEEWLAARRDKP